MTTDDTTTNWFLAQLKPNSHKIACRNLERQGFETFLPVEAETVRRNGEFKTTLKPLFPGYIFVGWSPDTAGWQSVNGTLGVTKLVAFGEQPAPVPDEIIAALMQRYGEAAALEKGDRVRVKSGPFVDFIAQVERVSPDQRVWLLLDLMGRKTRISAARQDVRRTE